MNATPTRTLATILCSLAIGIWAGVPALAQTPPSALITNAQALLAAPAGKTTVDPDTLMTADAVNVDEIAPFRWTGPHAASQWVAAVKQELVAHHVTAISITAGKPVEYVEGGGAAYLILPVTLGLTAQPKSLTEVGSETFTFLKVDGVWKVSSAVWTTAPAQP